ncbi:MAG TPA: ATP-binding protein [Pyrinomonadaceae bacterium]|nr:ATP-binding protein [Pyrinomonadaceae bacterium]
MSPTGKGEQVIIIAPITQDATAMAELLSAEGFETQTCQFADVLSGQFADGIGVLVLTEEALESPSASDFLKALRAQPSWSELPLVILTSGGESRRSALLDLAAGAAGAVTLLERPVSGRTLIRSVQVALHSRRRQYQVRDLLRELESLNQTLEQRVAQRTSEAIERAERLRILSVELTSAEETERRRIAEILHDDLQQMLIAARLQFHVLDKTEGAAKRTEITQEIEKLLDRSFNLTRSLIVELAPPILHECGLAAALQSLVTETKNHHNINITVEADASANPKEPSLCIFLFRAVRELLLNAVKHANGSPVHITMTCVPPAKVQIVIADRGPGFNPAKLNSRQIKPTGFGLFNIRERLSNFGGEFCIESVPGHGSRISLIAPRNSTRKGLSRSNSSI